MKLCIQFVFDLRREMVVKVNFLIYLLRRPAVDSRSALHYAKIMIFSPNPNLFPIF